MSEPLAIALAKLRRSTELACGYPNVTLTRAESSAILEFIDDLKVDVENLLAASEPRNINEGET